MIKFDKRYVPAFLQTVGFAVSVWAVASMATIPLLLCSVVMFYLYTLIGVVITYHRILAHRVGKMHPVVEFICTGLGFFGTLVSPVLYVGAHINHHKFMDTERDPHSPHHLGWKTLFAILWVEGGDMKSMLRMRRNKISNFYDKYSYPLLFVPLILLIWPKVFFFFWLIPMVASLWSQHMTTHGHDENGPKTMGLLYAIFSCGEHHHRWHHDHPNDTSGEGWIHYITKLLTVRN